MPVLQPQLYDLAVNGFFLDVIENDIRVTFDEGNSPWMTATATVARPIDSVMNLIDPKNKFPVALRLLNADLTTALTLSFWVQGRDYDPGTDTVSLVLVAPEYQLLTYSPTSPVDLRSATYQGSVLKTAQAVVSRSYPASSGYTVKLAPGTADQTFTTYSEATNLTTNGGFEYGVTGWAAQFSTITRDTGRKHSGSASMKLTPTTSNSNSRAELTQNLQAGTKYTLSAWISTDAVMTGSAASSGRYVYIAGAIAGTTIQLASSPSAPNVANQWNRVSLTFTTPSLLDAGTFSLRVNNGTTSSNAVNLWVDDIMIVEGDGLDTDGTLMDYFDGDTPDGNRGYTYDWQQTAGNSSSTRTPLIERDQASLLWTENQPADDFLRPILEATGLRMFQDEQGQFLLADNGYRVAGQVVMQSGSTLYEAREHTAVMEEDASGFPLNADAVVITYTWTDARGRVKTKRDVAKVSNNYSRPYTLVKDNTPFPGAGQAAYVLRRLQARTRQIETTGRQDWTNRPGMAALVSLPNRPAASGYVQALTFDMQQRTMAVTTKDLVTVLPGSVGKAPINQNIGAVSGTIAAYSN